MADFSPVDLVRLYQRAQAQFTDRVDAVAPDQWDEPALPEWSVADLVAHLVNEALWVPPLMAGETVDAVGDRIPEGTRQLLGDDPLTTWEAASDGALAAVAEDGALDRTVHLSSGPRPAADYVLEMTADLTVHAWDLARATDGDAELDGELVAACLTYSDRLPPEGIPGLIDPPLDVPSGAPPQTRLLARYGRQA